MKVSTTDLPPRQVSLEIEVEQERFDRAFEAAFQRIAGRVNVPGFRKGRAPRPMVERMVGREAIIEEALERLVPDVVNEAIEQEKVTPFMRPRVESIEVEPLRVRATVPLSPEIELGDVRAARIERPSVEVPSERIEEVIERLRGSYAQWVPVERAAQVGDRVGIDVRGTVQDGERVLLDTREAEYEVDPEGAQPAPGFAEQVVGMAPEETKQFVLNLPEDYRETNLAGQPVEFTVTLHWVKERELPELDEAFAQQVGAYADVAALREAVEQQLREREERRVREEVEQKALDRLVEVSKVEVPPQMVEAEAAHLREDFSQSLARQGLQLEQYLRLVSRDEATFADELRGQAERRIKRALALQAFATAESIGVETEEVEAEVRSVVAGSGRTEESAVAALGSPETVARVESALRERKALDLLINLLSGETDGEKSGKSRRRRAPAADTEAQPAEESESAAAGEKQEQP